MLSTIAFFQNSLLELTSHLNTSLMCLCLIGCIAVYNYVDRLPCFVGVGAALCDRLQGRRSRSQGDCGVTLNGKVKGGVKVKLRGQGQGQVKGAAMDFS